MMGICPIMRVRGSAVVADDELPGSMLRGQKAGLEAVVNESGRGGKKGQI